MPNINELANTVSAPKSVSRSRRVVLCVLPSSPLTQPPRFFFFSVSLSPPPDLSLSTRGAQVTNRKQRATTLTTSRRQRSALCCKSIETPSCCNAWRENICNQSASQVSCDSSPPAKFSEFLQARRCDCSSSEDVYIHTHARARTQNIKLQRQAFRLNELEPHIQVTMSAGSKAQVSASSSMANLEQITDVELLTNMVTTRLITGAMR